MRYEEGDASTRRKVDSGNSGGRQSKVVRVRDARMDWNTRGDVPDLELGRLVHDKTTKAELSLSKSISRATTLKAGGAGAPQMGSGEG